MFSVQGNGVPPGDEPVMRTSDYRRVPRLRTHQSAAVCAGRPGRHHTLGNDSSAAPRLHTCEVGWRLAGCGRWRCRRWVCQRHLPSGEICRLGTARSPIERKSGPDGSRSINSFGTAREDVHLDIGLIRPAQQVGGFGQVIFEFEQREGRGRAGSRAGQQRGLRPPSSVLTVDSFAVQDPQARSRTSQPTDRNANFALASLDR